MNDNVLESLGNLKDLQRLELLGCEGITPASTTQFFQCASAVKVFSYKEISESLGGTRTACL